MNFMAQPAAFFLLGTCVLASEHGSCDISNGQVCSNNGRAPSLVQLKSSSMNINADTVADEWEKCAKEGETCDCDGQIKYGHKGLDWMDEQWFKNHPKVKKWSYQSTSGTIKCNNAAFGGDPFPGQGKDCYCKKKEDASGEKPEKAMRPKTCADDDEALKLETGGGMSKCAHAKDFCQDPSFEDKMAKVCPETCGKCPEICADDDEALKQETEGAMNKCVHAMAFCKDPSFEDKMAKVCPETCGKCPQSCADDDKALKQETGGMVSKCSQAKDFCKDPSFEAKMAKVCPKTCSTCSKQQPKKLAPCEDDDDKLKRISGGKSCLESKAFCDDPTQREMMKKNCPRTCGSDGVKCPHKYIVAERCEADKRYRKVMSKEECHGHVDDSSFPKRFKIRDSKALYKSWQCRAPYKFGTTKTICKRVWCGSNWKVYWNNCAGKHLDFYPGSRTQVCVLKDSARKSLGMN